MAQTGELTISVTVSQPALGVSGETSLVPTMTVEADIVQKALHIESYTGIMPSVTEVVVFGRWYKGDKGDPGEDGKSAYEIWLEQGHTGTENDFLEWLQADSAQADWGENDTSDPSYVQNRTHYSEYVNVECVVDEKYVMDLSPYVVAALQHWTPEIPISGEFSEYIVNGNAIELGDYRQYIIDGTIINYYGNLKIYGDISGLELPNTGEDFVVMTVVGESIFIGVAQEYGDITSISFTTLSESVHKLDSKYLDSIPVSKIDGLADVAKSGYYTDIINAPTSLSYFVNDMGYINSNQIPPQVQSDWAVQNMSSPAYIQNKPVSLSEFTNDVGFITSSEQQVYYGTESGMIDSLVMRIRLSVNDISNVSFENCLLDILFPDYGIPTNGKFRFFDLNGNCYMVNGEPVDFSVYYHDGTITAGRVNAGDEVLISNQGGLYVLTNDAWNSTFSGDYNDLSNKPTIPVVPTDVSAFNNDAGYLTSYTETDPTVPSWAKQQSKPTYTANEVGAIPTTEKGANNGVATLGSDGRIPAAQLPSYVDDVLEYASLSNFPATGESGKIYIAQDTNRTYRWSGSNYAEISESLALGETSSTAYAGDKGKANADAIRDLQKSVINGSYLESSPLYWYGESTTAAATVQKEVTIKSIDSLNVGQIIVVQPTITSTVANSTLKLNNFDAYTMLYNNAAITTSTDSVVWNANYPTAWVFNGHYWVFLCHGLDSNTTYTINYSIDAGYYKAGSGTYAITRYSILAQKPDGTWEKITSTGTNYTTGTSKTANTSGFILNQLKYYATTTTVAGGANTATNVVYSKAASVDMRYSTNCGGATNWALGEYVYLVGAVGADGLFYLDTTTWWTNSLPSSNDGKLYIRLGKVLTASGYTISFFDDRLVFYHDGTSVKEYKVADNKQDVISDLSTIRSGAAAGATAVQPSSLAGVATSGSYNDLSDKPSIPVVPTNISAFTNDAGYVTDYDITHTSNSTVSTSVTVTFAAGTRGSRMVSTSADLGVFFAVNNSSDNYLWVRNTGSSEIDITINSVTHNSGSVSNVYMPSDGISVPAGNVCEIGIVCNADGAFITSRNDLAL